MLRANQTPYEERLQNEIKNALDSFALTKSAAERLENYIYILAIVSLAKGRRDGYQAAMTEQLTKQNK